MNHTSGSSILYDKILDTVSSIFGGWCANTHFTTLLGWGKCILNAGGTWLIAGKGSDCLKQTLMWPLWISLIHDIHTISPLSVGRTLDLLLNKRNGKGNSISLPWSKYFYVRLSPASHPSFTLCWIWISKSPSCETPLQGAACSLYMRGLQVRARYKLCPFSFSPARKWFIKLDELGSGSIASKFLFILWWELKPWQISTLPC